MEQNRIVVNMELQALLPQLTAEEYARLEKKLMAEGCTEPLKVWKRPDGSMVLIDGYNRHGICRKHGLAFEAIPVDLPDDIEAVKTWMIENQLGRRNINAFCRVELAAKLHGWTPEKAEKSRLSNLKQGKFLENSDDSSGKTDVTQQIADTAGVSRATAVRALAVLRNGTSDTIEMARTGRVSINQAYNAVAGFPDGMGSVFRNVSMDAVEKLKQAESVGWQAVCNAILDIHTDEKTLTAERKEMECRGITVTDAVAYRWESLRQELLTMQPVNTSYLVEDKTGYLKKRAMREKYHWFLFAPGRRLYMHELEHGFHDELKTYTPEGKAELLPRFSKEVELAEQFYKDGYISQEFLDGFREFAAICHETDGIKLEEFSPEQAERFRECSRYVVRFMELAELNRKKACMLIGDGGTSVFYGEDGGVLPGKCIYTVNGKQIQGKEEVIFQIH